MPFTKAQPGVGFALPPEYQLCCGSAGGDYVGQFGGSECNAQSQVCGLNAQYVSPVGSIGPARDLVFCNLNQFWWQNYGVKLYDIIGYAVNPFGPAVMPQPNVGRPGFALTPTLAPEPLSPSPSPDLTPDIGRPQPRIAPNERRKPPEKGTKEKKGNVQKGLAFAVQRAFDVTEGVDALNALYDALPDTIRQGVNKSGTVRPGGYAPAGTRYATAMDKAMLLYNNLGSLNLSQAAYNLLLNHLTDKIIGSIAGGAGRTLRRNGSSTQGGIAFGGMFS